jgi:hypothetical protein
MTVYSFYDSVTGLFTGQGYSGPADTVALQVPSGCSAIEGAFDPLSQCVDLALAAAKQAAIDAAQALLDSPDTDTEWEREVAQAAMDAALALSVVVDYVPPEPDDPDYVYSWNTGTKRWDATKTLIKEKADKRSEVRAARIADEFSTFTWDGHTFDGDAASQLRIIGATLLALQAQVDSVSFSIDWTLTDYSTVTLDGPDMLAVGGALAAYVDSLHIQFRLILADIDAAADAEAVQAIVWSLPA